MVVEVGDKGLRFHMVMNQFPRCETIIVLERTISTLVKKCVQDP
jgi:hypothetical protein